MPTKKSPFPGMDPFLEDSAEWGGVHARLINSISDQLLSLIPNNFSVKIEQRVYLNDIDYTAPVPPPRLRPADKNWVAAHLAAWQADPVTP